MGLLSILQLFKEYEVDAKFLSHLQVMLISLISF